MILPELFEAKMKELLKEEYEVYQDSFNQNHYSGLRINTLKITKEEFIKISPFELEQIPYIENGFYCNAEEQPARHPYYHAGLYYLQEPSAMTPASLLPVKPGDKVLDLCAAPGGKSTELAAKLQGRGVLVTNDISNSRAKALLKNIELFGVHNGIVMSEAPDKLERYFHKYFDKILVDAPCSGEGMFRKVPSMIKNWEEHGVDYYSNIQRDIIISAAKMLKPGGKMLYSTCTFSPEENEGTIAYLLNEFPEFRVINPLSKDNDNGVTYDGFEPGRPEWVNGPEELKNAVRLWPHKIKGEGHFICLLEKTGEPDNIAKSNEKKVVNLSKEVEEFLSNINFKIDRESLQVHEDKLYLMPKELPSLKGLRLLRMGLLLGEMKKNRFEPSHALAVALKSTDYKNVINLRGDDPNVIKYLKCETITLDDDYKDGFSLICVDGYPLGWGKLTGYTLKNKYIPGWRWM